MKLRFAHQLRAVAALAVVVNHYGGIFFSPVVRSLVGVPASFVVAQPGYTRHVLSPGPGGFLYGAFGVGVFFLISGLVIPISLRSLSTKAFLIRRFFRIYPVYWCCLPINVAMYVASSLYWSTPLPDRVSWTYVAKNLPLLHSASGIPSLDFVCWSLAVEVKFYVVFACIHGLGKRAHRVLALCLAFLLASGVGVYVVTQAGASGSVAAFALSDMKFMSFMFLGCVFYYVLFGEIGLRAGLGYGAAIYGVFLGINACYEGGPLGPLARNYSYALLLFFACYAMRDRFRRNRLLDVIADVSFPLYLVHSTIGYVAMPVLIDQGMPYTLAWMVSFLLAVATAFIVHFGVERPANALGASFVRKRTGFAGVG
jgi:peptidoglycan/LPS O-acetylase OafA/YrhL